MEDSKSRDLIKEFYLNCGFATRAVHAGEHVGQPHFSAHTGGIYQTSTFVFKTAEEGAQIFAGEKDGYMYTRLGNPSVRLLEAKVNALEGAEVKKKNPDLRISTLAFSSGMSAIASTLMALAGKGDTIIMGDVLYGATEHLASNVLKRFGINTVEVNTADLEAVGMVVKANRDAKAFFFETPANPLLVVSDIEAISRIVKSVNPNMKVIVDNTFATPYLQRPMELGADIVVHSTTKYICGHGTVVGGLATTFHDDVKSAIYTVIKDVGGSPSPFDSWLVNIGLKTLPVRMDKHCSNAMAIAEFLQGHPKVAHVHYPGLKKNPYYELAKRQMKDFGGMISFDLKGGLEAGKKLMNNIEIFTLAVSLGCVDSLIQHPASMTHACVPKEKREKGGLTDGLVRISVGIEDVDDLIKALKTALEKV
ncbi:MAG: methionine gamma-lyase [Deltaproteobacteria bacterium CG11_big_fil_rev_8_21_14_0_20_49_13]|nr:MAG: methionine gamma-lyase [Deltaproteobacteria bacterium CG11_big_fil_rev_8_21_14_0_20_49_13]